MFHSEKMRENPLLRENNLKFNEKLLHAQKMQTLFLGFQSLLPGLNIIHAEDLTGTVNSHEKHSPFNRDLQKNILLFGTLAEQISHGESPLHQLRSIWKIRQEKQLHSAKLCSIAPTQNPKTFAFISETPRKQKNAVSNKSQRHRAANQNHSPKKILHSQNRTNLAAL